MISIEQVIEEINEYHAEELIPETWYISAETGWVYRRSDIDGQLVRIKKRDARAYRNRYVPESIKK